MENKVKLNWLIRVGLLTILIGFFMPISCEMNGFQLAKTATRMDGTNLAILLYLVALGAAIPLIIGIYNLIANNKPAPLVLDVVCAAISIASGIIAYIKAFEDLELQEGAYIILIGWVLTVIFIIRYAMESSPTNMQTEPSFQIKKYSDRTCSKCGKLVDGSFSTCPHCGFDDKPPLYSHAVTTTTSGDIWTCAKCGEENSKTADYCKDCGNYR